MNLSTHAWTLLAQISRWQRLGDGLHGSRGRTDLGDLVPWLIGLAVIGGGVAIAAAVVKMNDFSQRCDDPAKLFRELCKAHKLGFANRRLLRQLAHAVHLKQPAEIFLSPTAFRPDLLPAHLHKSQAQIEQLRKRLF